MVEISRCLYTPQTCERRFPRRKTIVPGANFQMRAYLIDFSFLKQYNDNFKYILVVIDVFSKKSFLSFLNTKTSSDVIRAFEEVLPKIGRFQKLQTDLGSEFFNRPFEAWLKRQNIEHFHTHNFDTKATIVERLIRTLKEKLWRFFSHTNSRRYVDILPLLVNAYNNSYHTSIKRAPSTINPENQEHVWHTLYSQPTLKEPKLKVNYKVRLSTNRIRFRKGYLPSWTDQIFQVARV